MYDSGFGVGGFSFVGLVGWFFKITALANNSVKLCVKVERGFLQGVIGMKASSLPPLPNSGMKGE